MSSGAPSPVAINLSTCPTLNASIACLAARIGSGHGIPLQSIVWCTTTELGTALRVVIFTAIRAGVNDAGRLKLTDAHSRASDASQQNVWMSPLVTLSVPLDGGGTGLDWYGWVSLVALSNNTEPLQRSEDQEGGDGAQRC